ncbi:MAG: hypothetical protein HFF50_08350 [Lawsonibacter sp.]|nr:hypothetical protein [Lawsonibacter sp.]
MTIHMEEEVMGLFLVCAGLVWLGKAALGSACLRRRGRLDGAWFAHLGCELLSLYFLCRVLFQGRSPLFPAGGGILSIDNSVNIGLFGVFWAAGCLALVYVLRGRAASPEGNG